ncbi:MAG: [protein-PII] uridylyltransferase [Puniceicoccaceae bacterium]
MTLKIQDPLFRRIRAHAAKRITLSGEVDRATRTEAYREFYRLEMEMIRRYHRKGDSGFRVVRACSIVIDVLLENLFETAMAIYRSKVGSPPCSLSILGLGGYGRCEMAPHSDIDILFLNSNRKEDATIRQFFQIITEETLYPLWDIGMKIGHAVRNIKQVIAETRAEAQSKNAVLEARFVIGSESLYRKFDRAFNAELRHARPAAYIEAQIKAQKARRTKYGDTVFIQEPEIKNGVGGLRDYQLILWLARVRYGIETVEDLSRRGFLDLPRMEAFRGAYDFLLRVRNELHLSVSRPTDLLSLDRQPSIAWDLGYHQEDIFKRVEAFMKDYYHAATTIRRTDKRLEKIFSSWDLPQRGQRLSLRAAINARRYQRKERIEGFVRENDELLIDHSDVFQKDPIALLRVFRIAQQAGLKIDFHLESLIEDSARYITHRIVHSPEAATIFRTILQCSGNVYPTLSKMHELGVLGAYLPEFGRLNCLVQHEIFHRYTADIHVLRTIRELDRVFTSSDPFYEGYRRVLLENSRPALLYLILLLHDIGKADGIRDHDRHGARLAEPVLQRMNISERQISQILFVIQNHLEMARFSQRFDIDDPQTSSSFAQFVQDPERLRLLFVHTCCDARGTAEELWNGYKDSLHWRLFNNTLDQLTSSGAVENQAMERKKQLRLEIKSLLDPVVSEEELSAHFDLLPDRYFMYHSPREIALHVRMIHQLLNKILEADSIGSLVPVIDWQPVPEQGLVAVNIVTWDRAGLFYKLAGAFSMSGFNILSTKAISRDDHIAMDTFYIVPTKKGLAHGSKAAEVFAKWVETALVENRDLLPEIEEASRAPKRSLLQSGPDHLPAKVPSSINVYHELSLKRTIIEVRTADNMGLLFRITKAITDAGFDIVFARISTSDGIADDTFYIESIDPQGTIDNEALLNLRHKIADMIQAPELAA